MSADGLLGSLGDLLGHNMYAYTYNNPVMYTDIRNIPTNNNVTTKDNPTHYTTKIVLKNPTKVKNKSVVDKGYLAFKNYNSSYFDSIVVDYGVVPAVIGSWGTAYSIFARSTNGVSKYILNAYSIGIGSVAYASLYYGLSRDHYSSLGLTASDYRTAILLELGNIGFSTLASLIVSTITIGIVASLPVLASVAIVILISIAVYKVADFLYDEIVEAIYE